MSTCVRQHFIGVSDSSLTSSQSCMSGHLFPLVRTRTSNREGVNDSQDDRSFLILSVSVFSLSSFVHMALGSTDSRQLHDPVDLMWLILFRSIKRETFTNGNTKKRGDSYDECSSLIWIRAFCRNSSSSR